MVYTNKQKFNKKYNQPLNEANGLRDISKLSGVKYSILKEVFERGEGAWGSNIQSVRMKSGAKNPNVTDRRRKMGKEQWAYARVYSFVMGGKTQKTADKDLWDKHLKSKKK
jgi:hypothetical protein